MKKYIEPTTQFEQVRMHSIMNLSVNESGETKTDGDGFLNTDSPKRKLGTLYI